MPYSNLFVFISEQMTQKGNTVYVVCPYYRSMPVWIRAFNACPVQLVSLKCKYVSWQFMTRISMEHFVNHDVCVNEMRASTAYVFTIINNLFKC